MVLTAGLRLGKPVPTSSTVLISLKPLEGCRRISSRRLICDKEGKEGGWREREGGREREREKERRREMGEGGREIEEREREREKERERGGREKEIEEREREGEWDRVSQGESYSIVTPYRSCEKLELRQTVGG